MAVVLSSIISTAIGRPIRNSNKQAIGKVLFFIVWYNLSSSATVVLSEQVVDLLADQCAGMDRAPQALAISTQSPFVDLASVSGSPAKSASGQVRIKGVARSAVDSDPIKLKEAECLA